MRIFNNGYVNNTNDKLFQVNKNSKTGTNKVNSAINTENQVNIASSSVRETNISIRRVQNQVTRDQIAYEGLRSLKERLSGYSGQELDNGVISKINAAIQDAISGTRFNNETLLNETDVNTTVNNTNDFNEIMNTINQRIDEYQAAIKQSKSEMKELSLQYQNQMSAISNNNPNSIKQQIQSIVNDLAGLKAVTNDVMNNQVRELLN